MTQQMSTAKIAKLEKELQLISTTIETEAKEGEVRLNTQQVRVRCLQNNSPYIP